MYIFLLFTSRSRKQQVKQDETSTDQIDLSCEILFPPCHILSSKSRCYRLKGVTQFINFTSFTIYILPCSSIFQNLYTTKNIPVNKTKK